MITYLLFFLPYATVFVLSAISEEENSRRWRSFCGKRKKAERLSSICLWLDIQTYFFFNFVIEVAFIMRSLAVLSVLPTWHGVVASHISHTNRCVIASSHCDKKNTVCCCCLWIWLSLLDRALLSQAFLH